MAKLGPSQVLVAKGVGLALALCRPALGWDGPIDQVADRFAPQAFAICQLIGESSYAQARVSLSEMNDPIFVVNRGAIVSALESLQGGLGRCSHISKSQGGVSRMVFQRGYSIAFSWELPERGALNDLNGERGAFRPDDNGVVPQLVWRHFFAPHLEALTPDLVLSRLQHEHPSSVFSFHAESWQVRAAGGVPEAGADGRGLTGRSPQIAPKGEKMLQLGPQVQQLRIASLFKLAVFRELLERIRKGLLSWSDRPFELRGKSIEESAREMIVFSDNSETDRLVYLLRMHSVTPSIMLFRLKYRLPEFYRTIYPNAPEVLRRHIEQFANNDASYSEALCRRGQCNSPHVQASLDWTDTPGGVCAALRDIDVNADSVANAILSENVPFLEDSRRHAFSFIGFKGGRDLGVLAAAYLVRDKSPSTLTSNGNSSCAVVIWNDSEEDVSYGKFSYLVNWFFSALRAKGDFE